MEEERNKKKKNKKKKNKQANKPIEPVTIHAEGSASVNQSHTAEIENARNDIVEDSITDKDELRSNGTDGKKLAENDRQYWLDREASYEEKIKELQSAKDAQIQKESILEEKIKQLLEEKEGRENIQAADMVVQQKELEQLNDYNSKLVQNEAVLKEKLIQLEKEKLGLDQKVTLMERTIQQLENENATQLQRVATLEINILQLEGERNTWIQKESTLQENINEMKQEKDSWISKEASLEKKITQLEGERDSWIQKKASLQETISEMERERESLIYEVNSAKESIARTEDDNTNLRAKVLELEQSRNTLLEETVRLSESISNLQLEIKNLEKTTYSNCNSSAADKLITEDGNRVEASHGPTEKANEELNSELDQRNVGTDVLFFPGSSVAQSSSSGITGDSQVQANQNHETESSAHLTTEVTNQTLQVPESTQSVEDIIITKDDQTNSELATNDKDVSGIITSSSEIVEVDGIMQNPLEEENDARENTEETRNDGESDVPITDAPLIGAPFRFISFIARYVSGEDLVNKNTGKL